MDLIKSAQDFFQEKVDHSVTQLIKAGWAVNEILVREVLPARNAQFVNPNVQRFYRSVVGMPAIQSPMVAFDRDAVTVDGHCSDDHRSEILARLKGLIPWRKGPFSIAGITIDAEWRSDIKWNRIARPEWFQNRRVLDIGCNSGYYMFRMLQYHPRVVLGIDPSDLFFFQFHTILNNIPAHSLAYLPIKFEQLMGFDHWFDTVVCMGILYHQRSPIEALRQLRQLIKRGKGGVLVLETLVIDGNENYSITPETTYAKMANVYYLPTLPCLMTWIRRAGFRTVELLDDSVTLPFEQRRTEWVNTESLSDFLDPTDATRTIEGYSAPRRVVITCQVG